jgi:hypothetical protein
VGTGNRNSAVTSTSTGLPMENALSALSEELQKIGRELKIVVTGGHVMNVLGIATRLTHDVDVIGKFDEGRITKLDIDKQLQSAVVHVANTMGIASDWFNKGAEMVIDTIPPGMEKRLIEKKYGDNITAYYSSPKDLLFLKLAYAISGNETQNKDILALNPTFDEIEEAADWCVHDGMKLSLFATQEYLRKMGYGKVADRLLH